MKDQIDLFAGAGTVSVGPVTRPQEQIVRFGKYKNQPFEILLTDAQYSLWLLSSMFAKLQEQHPTLLAFLLNRYGMPDRTPDHNRLQNRFLDAGFAIRFAHTVSPSVQRLAPQLDALSPVDAWSSYILRTLKTEHERAQRMARWEKGQGGLEKVRDELLAQAAQVQFNVQTGNHVEGEWQNAIAVTRLQFESDGADVFYHVECYAELAVTVQTKSEYSGNTEESLKTISSLVSLKDGFRIEVKPIVGDDYPAVLRALKAVKGTHLLVGEYGGVGATWSEVVHVFKLSNITAVLLEDVEGTQVPQVFEHVNVQALTASQAEDIVRAAYATLAS